MNGLRLLLALLLATSCGAVAQTYYVATDDSDASGDGSAGTEWATITHALVRRGRYRQLRSVRRPGREQLMLGHDSVRIRAAFGIKGSRAIRFRANTVVGDLPGNAFAMRLNREAANPIVDDAFFHNNVWADPSGTMGADGVGTGNDFSDTPPADIATFAIANNLDWNGGAAVPDDPAEEINPSDDAAARFTDPQLASNSNAARPYWIEASGEFNGGYATIRAAFLGLVELYGRPGAGDGGLGQAASAEVPADDIRGVARGPAPYDIGAYERDAAAPLFADSIEDQ